MGAGLAREGSNAYCRLSPQEISGRRGTFPSRHSGFTLIEVLVALLVVAIAYTGVAQAISQFVDQRLMLVERHTSHRVAWNRLIEQYSISQGLNVDDREFGKTEGFVTARSGRWQWRISEQEAAGDSLIRYQVDVYAEGKKATDSASGSLVAFFTVPQGRR